MKRLKIQKVIGYLLILSMFLFMIGCAALSPPATSQKSTSQGNLPNLATAPANTGGTATGVAKPAASAAPMTAPGAPPMAGGTAQEMADNASLASPAIMPSATVFASAAPSVAATMAPSLEPSVMPTIIPSLEPKFFYFSYDDSASTVGAELTKNALKNNQMPDKSWARTYEFFNFEKFDSSNQAKINPDGLFSISMGIWKHTNPKNKEKFLYELGTLLSAPTMDMANRKNVVLTLLVDVSGSMEEPSAPSSFEVAASNKLELVKYGLEVLNSSLKTGDVINVCQFSDSANTLLENYQFSAADSRYLNTVRGLVTIGSTNLNAGIDEAYKMATKYYDSNKTNRVIILTDAYANTGEIDPAKISSKTRIENMEGIYFSGLGIGQDFNEAFLDKLTEAGKGAYFSIVSKTDARRAFGDRLISLLNVAARDVQFRLDYPQGLNHVQSAAEQISQIQSEVLPTNFSYNTSQFFLEGFDELNLTGLDDQTFKLTITYKDPETGESKTEIYEKKLSDLLGVNLGNIKDAYTIQLLTKLIKGESTITEANNILASLSDNSSPIFSEYRSLINTVIGKLPPEPIIIPTPPITPIPVDPTGVYTNSINPINVKIGDTFTISLDSNATTGYEWQFSQAIDSLILQLVSSQYEAPASNMVGAGGKQVWKFKALSSGTTSIALKYVRPWETGVTPIKTENFSVTVY